MSYPKTHPSASLLKTMGILNIVFASLGIVFGSCCIDLLSLFSASFGRSIGQMSAGVNRGTLEREARKIEAYKQQETDAQTDAEKKTLRAQRLRTEDRLKTLELSSTVGQSMPKFTSPLYIGHFTTELVTALTLNVLMLISGTGLLRFREWARKMSIWTAIARIVQIVCLAISYVGFVYPYIARVSAEAAKRSRELMVQSMGDFTKSSSYLYMSGAIIFALLSLAYPIVTVVLLNTRGARELCAMSTKPREHGAI